MVDDEHVMSVYADLLIFEESLRQEYCKLRSLRHKYLVFLLALLAWIAFFLHGTWIAPSGYYYVLFLYRIGLLAGLVTGFLFYVSGLYNATLVQPRNAGLLGLLKRQDFGTGSIKLILSGKGGIDTEFREGWELFRESYWDSERERTKSKAPLVALESKTRDRDKTGPARKKASSGKKKSDKHAAVG